MKVILVCDETSQRNESMSIKITMKEKNEKDSVVQKKWERKISDVQ
jgi:hypothetical protein